MIRPTFAFVLSFLVIGSLASAQEKLVIAHRGASGYLPEHTMEAYTLAHAQGADYIEPDLVLTKDKIFICMHDTTLQGTTNVEQVFPDRKRADGKWYAADFSLTEIKQLNVEERIPSRFPHAKSRFEVPTFVEMIELVQGLNKTLKREAGIYPELKDPTWHRENGLPMEEAVLALLTTYGYTGKDAKCFIQSFDDVSLKRLRNDLKTELPLVQCLSSDERQKAMLTQDGIAGIAAYANVIGPDVQLVIKNPELVTWAHDKGLKVHVYTLRADMRPDKNESFDALVKRVYGDLKCDGAWTDFPDQVKAALPK